MAGRKLIFREAGPTDVPRIIAAYGRWRAWEESQGKQDFVLPRDEKDLRSAAAKQLLYLVEDAETRDVLAITGVFDLRGDPDVIVELGGTYVDNEIRSRGFQSLFFEVRATAAAILNNGKVRLTTAINPDNEDSLRNAVEKNLFLPMAPVPEQTGAACGGCAKPKLEATNCCCSFYECGLPDARTLAKRFLSRIERSTAITMGPAGKEIYVDLKCQLAIDEDFSGAARSFAAGDWPKQ